MDELIKQTFADAYRDAVDNCKSMSDVHIHIEEYMEAKGFTLIDEHGPQIWSNFTLAEPREAPDGQPDAMQEWHDFDPEC